MTRRVTTQVGIVGAGPAGLVAALLLLAAGVEVVLVEKEARAVLEQRPRAGLVEHRVVEFLRREGLADGLLARGFPHGWCEMVMEGEALRFDYAALSGGHQHWVYPQQHLVADLLTRLDALGGACHFDETARALEDIDRRPRIRCRDREVVCDYVLCCDGPDSLAAAALPSGSGTGFRYPYDWLTALVHVDRPVEAVAYGVHAEGFAGLMPRAGRQARLYLQVTPGDDPARWPAADVRREFAARMGATADALPTIDEVIATDVVRMRGRVSTTVRRGRLLAVGDAAHVLTPSGAKGLNLAVADAADAARSLVRWYRDREDDDLAGYSGRRVREAWQVQEFSDRLLNLLHLPPAADHEAAFQLRLRRERAVRLLEPGPLGAAFAHWYAGSGRGPDGRGPVDGPREARTPPARDAPDDPVRSR
ncbi:FAD-dependent monooxygenase [Streptomyces sp. NPDC006997]|uniref:FAD-dependent monooxygenase n=1 Tax=Streptomyces sp. NPDC006997 TaxID=3155356 RepID=UPI0033E376C3